MRDMKEGRLSYNSSNDRYGLLVAGIWENPPYHGNLENIRARIG